MVCENTKLNDSAQINLWLLYVAWTIKVLERKIGIITMWIPPYLCQGTCKVILEGLTGFRNGNRFAKSLSCLSAKRDPIFLLIQVTKKRIHIRLLLCFSELDACGMYEYVTEIIYLTSYGKRHTAGLVILRAREDHI